MSPMIAWSPVLISCIVAARIGLRRPARSVAVDPVVANAPEASESDVRDPDAGGLHPGRSATWQSRWWLIVGLAVTALGAPLLGAIVGACWYGRKVARKRKRTRGANRQTLHGLGEVIDLFALTLASGATLVTAIEQASRWAPPGYSQIFHWCGRQADLGRPIADVLEDVPARLGEQVRPLIAALVAHDRYGAPIGPNLIRLSADARADRRRQAEANARRLPVAMLFPLVVCVLPAFMLLTVVPVVADTVGDLNFLASP